MRTEGEFEITLNSVSEDMPPAGRMIIDKRYTGGLVGSGAGQMLSKRTESGVAAYSAIEEFTGEIEGKSGSFTLIHNGYLSPETQSLSIRIIEGSGTGELQSIQGELFIEQKAGRHFYVLEYSL